MTDEERQIPNDETPEEAAGQTPEAEAPADLPESGDTPAPEESASEQAAPDSVSDSTPPEAAQAEAAPSEGDENAYSTEAETDEEHAALEVARAAMAALDDDDGPAPGQAASEQDALAAANAAIGALQDEVDSTTGTAGAPAGGATAFDWQDLGLTGGAGDPEKIDLLGDVNLNVKIELGRTRMLVEDVLRLDSGSVVELDKLAGDPVDIYVNGQPVARGEVLVLNDNFCVRISEILSSAQADAMKAHM